MMNANTRNPIGRAVDAFTRYRRERQLYHTVRHFDAHLLADIGMQRDEWGAIHRIR